MLVINGKISKEDLELVCRLYGEPELALPAPITPHPKLKGQWKINPHVSRFKLKDGYFVDIFTGCPIYYLHWNGQWRPMEEIAYHYGNHLIELKEEWDKLIDMRYFRWLLNRMELIGGKIKIPSPFGMIPIKEGVSLEERAVSVNFLTTDFYPDADPETTSVDGFVRNQGVTYSIVQSASTGDLANDDLGTTSGGHTVNSYRSATNDYRIIRSFFLFDTSSLTDNANISSATLSIYGAAGLYDTDGDGINVYSSNPTSNIALAVDDFGSVGSTPFSTTISLSSWLTTSYNDFILNSNGIANISLTGVSKFSTRQVNDVSAITPTGENSSSCYWADQTGTSQDPKLSVVYTIVYSITTSENLNITEDLSKQTAYTIEKVNILNLSDIVSKTWNLSRVISENLGITDIVGVLQKKVVVVLDAIQTSEVVVKSTKFLKSVSEELGIIDAVSKITRFSKVVSDAVSLTESVIKSMFLTIVNTLKINEGLTKSTQFFRTFTESINISDAVSTIREYFVNIIETIQTSDAVSTFKHFGVVVSDRITLISRVVRKGFGWLTKHSTNWTFKDKS